MPHKHHFLDLDTTYKDAFGDPLLRITFDFEEQDHELVKFMGAKCGEIIKEMGADTVVANTKQGAYEITQYQSTHNTGGVIMGSSLRHRRLITTYKCGMLRTSLWLVHLLSRITVATILQEHLRHLLTGQPKVFRSIERTAAGVWFKDIE